MGGKGVTLTLPSMSLLTGVKATEPSTSSHYQKKIRRRSKEGLIPNRVVNDSAASRNSVVEMALSFSLSTGTSVKDLLSVSRKVPPGGYALVVAIAFERSIVGERRDVGRLTLVLCFSRHWELGVGQGVM